MNDNDYNEYIILDDDMIDISSKSEQKQGSDHKSRYSKKGKSKKKLILIISSVAAAVVIAGGITGICLYNNGVFITDLANRRKRTTLNLQAMFTFREFLLTAKI